MLRVALSAAIWHPGAVHVPNDADYQQTLAARAADLAAALAAPREPVARTEDIDAGGVPARLYVPTGCEQDPFHRGLIVHLHGGGFVFNGGEVHDAPARRLANRTRRTVLRVDYRLAPEHPFPAAIEDVDAVLDWAAQRSPLVVAHGDSAGGNLALVGTLHHLDRVAALVLIYPFLDPASGYGSYGLPDMGWDRDEAQWYWRQYLDLAADPTLVAHPDVAPLASPDLAGLPPTLVITAERDIARDEGEHLLAVLQEKGVDAVGSRALGVPHGFWRNPEYAAANDLAMRQTAGFLDAHMDDRT